MMTRSNTRMFNHPLPVAMALTLLSAVTSTVDGQNLQWATVHDLDITNGDMADYFRGTVDQDGNTYGVGTFVGTADLEPGAGITLFTSQGSRDIFVTKLSPTGAPLWTIVAGGTGYDAGMDITVSSTGDLYVGGSFEGTVDMDPGSGTQLVTSAGNKDAFLWKLDPADGSLQWVKTIGASSADDVIALSTDANGNVWATGRYYNTVDMDPGPGTASLTTTSNMGNEFIWKLSPTGQYLASGAINTNAHTLYCITAASNGDVLLFGRYSGATTDADPGPGTANLPNAATPNTFIARYDSTGAYQWSKAIAANFALGVTTDNAGNVLAAGSFDGTVDFDPGPGTDMHTGDSEWEPFVWKLDAQGDHLWVKEFEASDLARVWCITTDAQDNIFTVGEFWMDVDMDPGPGTVMLTSAGVQNGYINVLDQNGQFVWAGHITGNVSIPAEIGADAWGNMYVSGWASGPVDFDPGAAAAQQTVLPGGSFYMKLAALPTAVPDIARGPTGIFPVPTSNVLHVSTEAIGSLITLFSMDGTLIRTQPTTGTTTTLDMSPLAAGVYLLHVDGNGTRTSHRVVKH